MQKTSGEAQNMEKYDIYSYGYGTVWQDVCVYHKEAYSTSVSDFHRHDFYEINLIISGNVKALTKNRREEGLGAKILLAKPGDAHFVSCLPDTLYKRIYLVFTRDFIENGSADWLEIRDGAFGDFGRLISLDDETCREMAEIMDKIGEEKTNLAKRMLIYYFLAKIRELRPTESYSPSAPPYLFEALSYIEGHMDEKIVAKQLADRLHIGRTALLTAFKSHTGLTLGAYLDNCRLRRAAVMLSEGKTTDYAAAACGFSDPGGLIRCFKRHYGLTPLQYVKSLKN